MVMGDRRLTVNQIVNDVRISCERVENVLHSELGMSKVSVRCVPRLLTPDQNISGLVRLEAHPACFLERFPTQVEPTNLSQRQKGMQWKHPFLLLQRRPRFVSSVGNAMSSVFWEKKPHFVIFNHSTAHPRRMRPEIAVCGFRGIVFLSSNGFRELG